MPRWERSRRIVTERHCTWVLLNTVFALEYTRLYYLDEDGGIDFKQEQLPATGYRLQRLCLMEWPAR